LSGFSQVQIHAARFGGNVTLRYVYIFPSRARDRYVMAEFGVAGYRQILENLESPARWKEKTLQAGW